jgi:hypothetical protein
MSLAVTIAALCGASLAIFIPAASAAKPQDTTTCPYNEYTQYSQYQQYCTSSNTSTPPATPSSQTIAPTGTAKAAGVTVNTTYPNASTLVNVNLPAGTVARKFYMYTTLGVSFGVNHSPAVLKKDILVYNGSQNVKYTITKLSRPHGRIHLTLAENLAAPTFKVNKNVFEFTPRERRIVEKFHIKKTLVTVQVTTTTGKVYNVKFRALFGALVVVKFH